ncbi:putative F-box protein at3g58860 [Phtheirospermum japonicum]|uniref:Putative F-box protein at3g58860 n=1 Tax=Phtheirospermum japonicum TaxID=374723 RepID=A0A830BYY7_9LAMI|nr:putative F-box protein at3g58860 [Phtheirospermum japonicum]
MELVGYDGEKEARAFPEKRRGKTAKSYIIGIPTSDFSPVAQLWPAIADMDFQIHRELRSEQFSDATLPDDLLVSILSFLSLKEAATTSALSRRWRYLWTLTPKLDFDFTKSLHKIELKKMGEALLNCERRKYVRWVNRVLASRDHHHTAIFEFRVFFDLSAAHKKSLDQWLAYALSRKLERLELNLTDEGSREGRSCDECYAFPNEFLRTDSMINFECLKRVSLNFVNVGCEALDYLLCNCPRLEELSVSHSYNLYSVEISGVCCSLKRLEISNCDFLESVEIRDSNLVYLKYQGPETEMFYLAVKMRNLKLLVVETHWLEEMKFEVNRCKEWLEPEIVERKIDWFAIIVYAHVLKKHLWSPSILKSRGLFDVTSLNELEVESYYTKHGKDTEHYREDALNMVFLKTNKFTFFHNGLSRHSKVTVNTSS